jgi:hypothetical protein
LQDDLWQPSVAILLPIYSVAAGRLMMRHRRALTHSINRKVYRCVLVGWCWVCEMLVSDAAVFKVATW